MLLKPEQFLKAATKHGINSGMFLAVIHSLSEHPEFFNYYNKGYNPYFCIIEENPGSFNHIHCKKEGLEDITAPTVNSLELIRYLSN